MNFIVILIELIVLFLEMANYRWRNQTNRTWFTRETFITHGVSEIQDKELIKRLFWLDMKMDQYNFGI
jgi:hypothetical protein